MKWYSVFLVLFVATSRVAGRTSIIIPELLLGRSSIEEPVIEEASTDKAEIVFQDRSNLDESETDPNPSLTRRLYTGNQLWKTYLKNTDQIKLLISLKNDGDLQTWGGNTTSIDILVNPESVNKTKESFRKANITYEVVIDDLQKAINEENPPVKEETDDRKGHRLTWHAYHRAVDINGYLDYLGDTYPDLCTVKTIGHSVHQRPIKLIKISNGNPNNKAIWIDGGIHAREWITPATATYIINHLTSNFEHEPQYVQNLDWYIAPLMNPDGYEYTHTIDRLWRKNRARDGICAGTDLNRNFGYRWGGQGASRNPCTETYSGSGPFSEPETAAIENFITGTAAKWKAYISLHSYGQYILYPWGYNRVVPPDHQELAAVGRRAAEAIRATGGPSYTVGPAGSTLYPASGGSDDWAKGSKGFKYAYTIELRDNGRHGFVLPANYIDPTAKETLAAVRVIAEAASKA